MAAYASPGGWKFAAPSQLAFSSCARCRFCSVLEISMHDIVSTLPIRALLQPRAIALVGVSPRGGAGANILRSGQRFGFSVQTWPVNPNYGEIAGHRCYKSLRDLPAVPDCVVVSLPADAVIDVVKE